MALVVTRVAPGQTCRPGNLATIRIGDDITITLIGIKGNQARIAIEAPRSLSVHREEVYQRILAERGSSPDLAPNGDETAKTDGNSH